VAFKLGDFSPVRVLELIFSVLPRALDSIVVDCYILPSFLIVTPTTEASLMLHYVMFVALFRQTLIYTAQPSVTTVVPGTTLSLLIAVSVSASRLSTGSDSFRVPQFQISIF